MSTVADLIKDSLLLIGAIATGETPTSAESADALRSLNRMIDAWSVEGLLIFKSTREEFSLVPSQSSYTFGLTGNFNSARPMNIERVTAIVSGYEYPVEILNAQQWSEITDKSLQGDIPRKVYFEGTYPLETVNVWPVPSAANELGMYTLKPLSQFASTAETVSLPPGYEDCIVHNLGARLAPGYGKPADPVIMQVAEKTKASIKRKNIKPVLMKSDVAGITCRGSYNIFTGN